MIVIYNNSQDIRNTSNYIALGSFDGLHVGHCSLIQEVVKTSKEKNCSSMVFTFKNHPRTFINKDGGPKLLMDNESKEKLLDSLGVDIVCFKEFDKEFMKIKPEEFVKTLVEKYNAKGIVVGFNYRFGYKNSGDTNLLNKLKDKYGYDLHVMEPCTYENEVISSTRIREALEAKNVFDALKMLGRPYSLKGEVTSGRKIGRTIGFPTANLKYNKNFILPGIGVYYTNVIVNNNIYKGITSVGNNPTVEGKSLTVETYILDFNENIYGHIIEVNFIKKIRDEKKFDSLKELKEQLNKDKDFARNEICILH